jgi:branched-chain amino acid transport system ATP-binding protein
VIPINPMKEIFEFVRRRSTEENVSILLAEQNAHIALSIVEYAYIIEGGQIVSEGPADVLSRTDMVRQFYLGMADKEEHLSYRRIFEEKRA